MARIAKVNRETNVTGHLSYLGTGIEAKDVEASDALTIYEQIHYLRTFLDREVEVFKEGFIPGALHPGNGHEAIHVGSFQALRSTDWISPSHRGAQAWLWLRGIPIKDIWAELMAKDTGVNGGRRGDCFMGHLGLRVFPMNPVLGHGPSIGNGNAFALRYFKSDDIHVAFLTDGASAAGTVWESNFLAGIYKLPMVIVVENNGYAYSTPFNRMTPTEHIAARAAGWGFPGVVVDGMDPFAVRSAVSQAAARARAGEGPTLIECKTYRFVGHFVGDPEVYRSKEEVRAARERDSVPRVRRFLLDQGWATEDQLSTLESNHVDEIEAALEEAKATGEQPRLEDVMRATYREGYYAEGYST
jgi:TPP-dependent pyruvate/acetoin dehydrogenase alpha subunit